MPPRGGMQSKMRRLERVITNLIERLAATEDVVETVVETVRTPPVPDRPAAGSPPGNRP